MSIRVVRRPQETEVNVERVLIRQWAEEIERIFGGGRNHISEVERKRLLSIANFAMREFNGRVDLCEISAGVRFTGSRQ